MQRTVEIDGTKFRALLSELGIKQTKLAQLIGVTHFAISRWCAAGAHHVKMDNLTAIAEATSLPVNDLVEKCAANGAVTAGLPRLNDAEQDWLDLYTRLSPLERAKVRVAVQEIIDRMDEKKKA